MLSRRQFAACAAALGLSACDGRSITYRYKLTLAVATSSGIKTAFNVAEVLTTQAPTYWGKGGGSSIRGEAIYVDLGPGKRPLIALLTRQLKPGESDYGNGWGSATPSSVVAHVYGYRSDGVISAVEAFIDKRGAREIEPSQLPDLITFEDIRDPRSVLAVDPHDPSKALLQDVRWHRLTIEVTGDSLTSGIEERLPWLAHLQGGLDGSRLRYYGEQESLANRLNADDFVRNRHY